MVLSQLVVILNSLRMARLAVGAVSHHVSVLPHYIVRGWRIVMDVHRVFVILSETHKEEERRRAGATRHCDEESRVTTEGDLWVT